MWLSSRTCSLTPLAAFIATLSVGSMSLPALASTAPEQLSKTIATLEQRIERLEAENNRLNQSLDEPYISDSEPEVSARLKAVESQANSYRKAARTVEGLEGIEAGVGLLMVAQQLSTAPSQNDVDSALNYRADVTVSLPAGGIGASEGFIFSHFRMGQGLGLENPDDAFSSLNGTSFQRPGSETSDSTVLLAQAWYQLNIPLPLGGNSSLSREHLELNVGKIDPFMFFDQNSIADDESRGFINQALVHNPLLDVGGDVGVDDFGFTPGLRLAWLNDSAAPKHYGVSMGVFAAGDGASFNDSLTDPFVIMQVETSQPLFSGLLGNYRLYYWRNGQSEDLAGGKQAHAGFGVSLDQKLDDYLTLFARYGQQTQGDVKFDQALTVGVDFGGSYWHRAGDAIGVAYGWLKLSDDYQKVANSLVGFNAAGAEQLAEVYYRYRINSQLALSPNVQLIRHPGGNQTAANLTSLGLRVQVNY